MMKHEGRRKKIAEVGGLLVLTTVSSVPLTNGEKLWEEEREG